MNGARAVLAGAVLALTFATTACSNVPLQTTDGTVVRYHQDTRSSGDGFFELEGSQGVYYCPIRNDALCATVTNGDKLSVTYYENNGFNHVTKLTRNG